MYSKKQDPIRKEIKLSKEIDTNLEQISNSNPPEETELLIINNDEEPKMNCRYYQKELYINDNNKKTFLKKQIYKKIRSDSYKPANPKAQISNYIYHTNKPKLTNNLTTDYIKYNSNSKYLIKNPIKEKSKNKLNNINSHNENIQNKNKNNNTNNRNLRLINSIINNTDINEDENNYNNNNNDNDNEDIKFINNTNYNFRPGKNLDINNGEIKINLNKNKGGNINLHPKKKQYISFNKKFNTNYKNIQHSPRESRISYIYDYSQENNKDSYYVESPNVTKHLTVYPLKTRIKKKHRTDYKTFNNKSPKKNHNKLKKQIEDSRLKFEKIREIEKKIKNYFNINGLDIENRELYDQSATMIQSAFRAYYSRMKLFKELNSFVNIGLLIDIIKKIFISKKIDYWENFLKGILNYLSYINNLNNENNENTENLIDINNNDKIIYIDKKVSNKIPNSYRRKTGAKKNKNINTLLIPQLCVSFDLINNNEYINKDIDLFDGNINEKNKYLEEKLKEMMLENERLKKINEKNTYEHNPLSKRKNNINNLNNNIVKNTQESVELQFDDETNLPLIYNNNDNIKELQKTKLKYLLKSKILKIKEYLHKYFLKYYYNTILIKNLGKMPIIYTKNIIKSSINGNSNNSIDSLREKKEEKIYKKKIKKLRKICIDIDKKIKNNIHNKFTVFNFKGLINEIKNKNQNNDNNENMTDDKNINIEKNENIENIENINDDNKKD